MVRKPVVIFTSLVLLAAANAKALGLGDITLESALNQPLRANIPLLQLGDVRAEQISVQLASESDFARFSIDREAFLGSMRFDVQSAGTDAVVQISTRDAVREPYLSFVLETRWPTGRLLSEYTVLLDLPAFADNAPSPAVRQAEQQAAPASSVRQQDLQNQSVGQPSSGSSSSAQMRLAAPADPASTPAAQAPEPAPALIAQVDPDTSAAAISVDALAAPAPQVPEPATAPTPTPTPAPRAAPDSQDTITTDANDTLWDIALEVRPDSTVSVQQTMLAIQRLNTDAFIGDNINMVRRGQVLRIPDIDQIRALSSREAIGEVARQNQLFENRRNVPLTSQPVAVPPTAPATAASAPRGELSVVSVDNVEPGAQTASGQSAELDARIASLEDVLAVQREEADRAALQNAELTERLGLLEEQIASAQEIIRLRDLELAQLQESLANVPVVEVAPVEPPTVITMAPERSFLQTLLDTLVANTLALLAVTALVISLLVFMLLKRNRAAEQVAALAGMDDIPGEPRITEPESVVDAGVAKNPAGVRGANAEPALDTSDFEEIFDLAASADDDLFDASEGSVDADLPIKPASEVDDSADVLMAEANALLAEGRFPEAVSFLQDSIVVQPERTDLRLKLLEAFAAAQDAVGFKLQETELRDIAGESISPQIAILQSRLRDTVSDDILEQGDLIEFDEDTPLDDLELALDMEASAEVDDAKVLSGFAVDEDARTAIPAEAEKPEASMDSDAFPLPELDFDLSTEADDSIVEFDSGSAVEIAPELTVTESVSATNVEDDNLLDFDFDLSIDEVEPAAAEASPADAEDVHAEEAASDNAMDFDFVMSDDEPELEEVAAPAADSGVDEEDFVFDDSVFDLAIEEDAEPKASMAEADDFEDLQFVDDSLLDSIEKPAMPVGESDDDDFEYLSDADEAATKLDLARAYYEMGDGSGAREILEEVLREGNDDQIKDARELLSKL